MTLLLHANDNDNSSDNNDDDDNDDSNDNTNDNNNDDDHTEDDEDMLTIILYLDAELIIVDIHNIGKPETSSWALRGWHGWTDEPSNVPNASLRGVTDKVMTWWGRKTRTLSIGLI